MEEEHSNEKTHVDKFLEKIINFFYSDDSKKWLVLIFLLGVILRFVMTRNVSALGDEMVHGPHAIGFLHSGLISTILHSPLWFYLGDIAFKIFGVTLFSMRFLSFFYGSLTILLVYLLASKIFSKKVGLISSFLLATSYFIVRYTLAEMDISITFFLILALFSFIENIEKKKFPLLAAVSIGVASLIKTLSLFFVPAFLVAFFIFNKSKEKEQIKKNIKNAFMFGLIILLFFSPIIIHNYLWYQDKGMVDTYVAQYFDIGNTRQAYEGQRGYDSGFLFSEFITGLKGMSKSIFYSDPIIILFGLLGIIFSFASKNKRKYWYLLFLFNILAFALLLLSNHLPTHYTPLMPVMCIFAGFFVNKIARNVSEKLKDWNYKKLLITIIICTFIFQLYLLAPHLTSETGLGKMRNYAIDNMDKNSLVISDARIYRGRMVFLFNDFHYLESSYFPQILSLNQNISGQDAPTKVYFIECVPDDCGWGTVTAGPLNDSSEQWVKTFSEQGLLEKTIYGGGGYGEEKGEEHFKVYSATIPLKPQVLNVVDSTHDWFYYPVNYLPKEKIFDTYKVKGFFNSLFYKFAWLVIIVSIILAILLSIFPFYELFWMK